jgi:predicted dehydrogenase
MPQEGFARLDREGNPMVPQQWRLTDGVVPTISLDLGVHVHHLVDFLTGEKPQEVVATNPFKVTTHAVSSP